jgi:N-acetylneuraminic acid mutarotase
MRTKSLLIVLVLMLCAVPALAQWEVKAILPEALTGGDYVSDGYYLYYVGGGSELAPTQKATLYRYNPALDAWDTLEPLPVALAHVDAVYLDGYIYVPGGDLGASAATATMYIYDIATDTWSTGADAPLATEGYGAALVNGMIHRVGGWNYTDSINKDVHYAYDPANDTWSTLASMSTARWSPAVFGYDGKLYVAGGNDASFARLELVSVYDPDTDSWDDLAIDDLPSGRMLIGDAVGINGNGVTGLLAIGGADSVIASDIDDVAIYDFGLSSWVPGPALPAAEDGIGATCIDGFVYAAGGGGFGTWVDDHIRSDFHGTCDKEFNPFYEQLQEDRADMHGGLQGLEFGDVWAQEFTPSQYPAYLREVKYNIFASGVLGDEVRLVVYYDTTKAAPGQPGTSPVYRSAPFTIPIADQGWWQTVDLSGASELAGNPITSGQFYVGLENETAGAPGPFFGYDLNGYSDDKTWYWDSANTIWKNAKADFALEVAFKARPTIDFGCEIGGVPFAAGDANPANECEVCNPTFAPTAWTNAQGGTTCDDGLFCTDNDSCSAGVCGGDPLDCPDGESCNETTDACEDDGDDDDDDVSDDDDDADDDDAVDDDAGSGGDDDDDSGGGCCG